MVNALQVCYLRVKNFLIMLSNLLQMRLKLLQKEQFFKKQHKQLVIRLLIKFLIELQKFHKIHNKITQKQL